MCACARLLKPPRTHKNPNHFAKWKAIECSKSFCQYFFHPFLASFFTCCRRRLFRCLFCCMNFRRNFVHESLSASSNAEEKTNDGAWETTLLPVDAFEPKTRKAIIFITGLILSLCVRFLIWNMLRCFYPRELISADAFNERILYYLPSSS